MAFRPHSAPIPRASAAPGSTLDQKMNSIIDGDDDLICQVAGLLPSRTDASSEYVRYDPTEHVTLTAVELNELGKWRRATMMTDIMQSEHSCTLDCKKHRLSKTLYLCDKSGLLHRCEGGRTCNAVFLNEECQYVCVYSHAAVSGYMDQTRFGAKARTGFYLNLRNHGVMRRVVVSEAGRPKQTRSSFDDEVLASPKRRAVGDTPDSVRSVATPTSELERFHLDSPTGSSSGTPRQRKLRYRRRRQPDPISCPGGAENAEHLIREIIRIVYDPKVRRALNKKIDDDSSRRIQKQIASDNVSAIMQRAQSTSRAQTQKTQSKRLPEIDLEAHIDSWVAYINAAYRMVCTLAKPPHNVEMTTQLHISVFTLGILYDMRQGIRHDGVEILRRDETLANSMVPERQLKSFKFPPVLQNRAMGQCGEVSRAMQAFILHAIERGVDVQDMCIENYLQKNMHSTHKLFGQRPRPLAIGGPASAAETPTSTPTAMTQLAAIPQLRGLMQAASELRDASSTPTPRSSTMKQAPPQMLTLLSAELDSEPVVQEPDEDDDDLIDNIPATSASNPLLLATNNNNNTHPALMSPPPPPAARPKSARFTAKRRDAPAFSLSFSVPAKTEKNG